ncbi:hypothetical protein CY34DRAFT_337618 [Suillus luteus UH-Slu-Lm8-n1]|uniref:Unplaced genomic scaffold CY34scaffold_213, whole genome shotgun sequence n=1 Tax=Suillus luteus UH-Slu-Lm8-n1 TaxID=930992 RepID=A0A0D0ACG5_9AGAM|nr:hypothetical protein CY34DRAFT_337618 [Suillus luteus UH-Slu-Lm8-n1]
MMVSFNRPWPGVRLDYLEQLIPGCEWYISPLGRTYFVNHTTQTTSWKKPTPERPTGSLTLECVIEGHSECIWSLACLDSNGNIFSTSNDGSIRQWKRDGEPVGKPLNSHGARIGSLALSPDGLMVVSGSADGRLRLWNIAKGSIVGEPWEGHNDAVRCLDWSFNALEIASGSEDGTIRLWNPHTGRQIVPPIVAGHGWVYAVKYSSQGDKFVSGGGDRTIRVWSKDGQLLIEIMGHEYPVMSLCWSKDSTHIFSGSVDNTIRKWRSIERNSALLFGVTPTPSSAFVFPPMTSISSVHRWITQLTSRPISKSEIRSCMTTKS